MRHSPLSKKKKRKQKFSLRNSYSEQICTEKAQEASGVITVMLGLNPTGKEYCNIVLVATVQLGRARKKLRAFKNPQEI